MGDQIITAADYRLGFNVDKQLRWLSKKGILREAYILRAQVNL